MTPSFPTARLDVDLGALLHNYQALQARAPAAEVAPVVKADAYGLGMAQIAPFLVRQGARTFFVARLDEGVALRKVLGLGPVIYVLDGFASQTIMDINTFLANDLQPVLNSLAQFQQWVSGPDSLKAALHVDTGMNRLGVRPEEAADLPSWSGHNLTMVMSHLACGDEPNHPLNARQLSAFKAAAAQFPGVPKSLANSAGSFLDSAYHFDIIRPGISLYGGGPEGIPHPDIKAVAHLSARVLQVRDLKAGESAGYGATFIAEHNMRLATVGLGYADGLLRSFAGKGCVAIKGERHRLTGRMSMDVFSLDVTGLDVTTDDWVEVLGAQQSLDEAASAAGTIGYEFLTRLGPRIARSYKPVDSVQ